MLTSIGVFELFLPSTDKTVQKDMSLGDARHVTDSISDNTIQIVFLLIDKELQA